MKILQFIAVILFAMSGYTALAQNNTEADFKKTEPEIVKTIKWLETTVASLEERKPKNALVFKWISDCPYVSVELNADLIGDVVNDKSYEYGGDMMMIFIFGSALYLIEHPKDTDKVKSAQRGYEGMITYYKALKKAGKKADNKFLDKLEKMQKDNKMASFIADKLKKK